MNIDIQKDRVNQVMVVDRRGIFKRLSKLLEEQGELHEAYLANDIENSIEEIVDNFLVLISLAHEIDNNCFEALEQHAVRGIVHAIQDTSLMLKNDKSLLLMKYAVSIGKVSDILQKHEKIISSAYKGTVTKEEVLAVIYSSIENLMHFCGYLTTDYEILNELIDKKTLKWVEKVS